jgi:hypothetical protein
MADRSKFEKMLELLVNEDKEAAEELFHEIVVEKSRQIYETLLSEEIEDEDLDEASDDEDLDEASDDDDEDLDEGFDLDEFQMSSDLPDVMGGDETDDLASDMDDRQDDMGDMDDMGNMDNEGDMDDRLMDLEDAFKELKAEFEAMMGDKEDDEEMEFDSEDDEVDDEGDMEFGADDEEEEDDEENMPPKESFTYEAKKPMKKDDKAEKKSVKKTAGEEMREYVEKIGGAHYHQYGKMGDNGTNTRSAVAGKNDMGGTAANILRADTEQGTEANKGQLKGSSLIKQTPQAMNTRNVNVPGSKTATKMTSVAKGHGAEKRGAGETADKSAGSVLNGAPKRAK